MSGGGMQGGAPVQQFGMHQSMQQTPFSGLFQSEVQPHRQQEILPQIQPQMQQAAPYRLPAYIRMRPMYADKTNVFSPMLRQYEQKMNSGIAESNPAGQVASNSTQVGGGK